MAFRLLTFLLFVISPWACHSLKMSPQRSPPSSVLYKRQASSTTDASVGGSAPSVTTLRPPNPFLPPRAQGCVCKLISPFNQYNTITSTYIADASHTGLSTSTLNEASGTTPGTVEVFTPITLSTSTVTSGTAPLFTTTTATTYPGGYVSSYVLVDYPELSTVTTYSGSVTTTVTVSTTDAAGNPTNVVVVDLPLSTSTFTSGSVGYTSTITSTGAGNSATPYVVVDMPVPLCGNQGWQWAYAQIPAADHGFKNDFDFSSLQCNVDYIHQDTTDAIYIPQGIPNNSAPAPVVPGYYYDFYGKYNAAIAPAAINHRAFFIPPSTGTYTFKIIDADDEAAIWIGDVALTNWNNGNELVVGTYTGNYTNPNGATSSNVTTVQLNVGACTPIRVAWIDGSAPGGLSIGILGPDGMSLDGSNYIRDTCCDATVSFNSFGNECATPPTPSTTTIYSGSTAYTSTVVTSDASGNPTKVVVIESPASTTTVVGGTSAYTTISTVTPPNGSPSAVVVVDEPLCGNQGWQWAYARIQLYDYSVNNDFDYSTLQTATYQYIGTTSSIGLDPGTPPSAGNGPYPGPQITYYGQYTDSEGASSINHRAFFIAPTDGTYTFMVTMADDEAAIFLNGAALRGYNNNNEAVETYYSGGSRSTQVTLTQNSCTPIRVIWVDGSSPGAFGITITGPDGSSLENSTYVRDTCCGNPYTYSAFGSEA